MEIKKHCYIYKIVSIPVLFEDLEYMNRTFGYNEFSTCFMLDKEAYSYNQEQIKLGKTCLFDFNNILNNTNELNLLLDNSIDYIMFYVD